MNLKKMTLAVIALNAAAFSSVALADSATQWFCSAQGYDRTNHLAQVNGEYCATEKEAQDSAMKMCHLLSYVGCEPWSCFELPTQ